MGLLNKIKEKKLAKAEQDLRTSINAVGRELLENLYGLYSYTDCIYDGVDDCRELLKHKEDCIAESQKGSSVDNAKFDATYREIMLGASKQSERGIKMAVLTALTNMKLLRFSALQFLSFVGIIDVDSEFKESNITFSDCLNRYIESVDGLESALIKVSKNTYNNGEEKPIIQLNAEDVISEANYAQTFLNKMSVNGADDIPDECINAYISDFISRRGAADVFNELKEFCKSVGLENEI